MMPSSSKSNGNAKHSVNNVRNRFGVAVMPPCVPNANSHESNLSANNQHSKMRDMVTLERETDDTLSTSAKSQGIELRSSNMTSGNNAPPPAYDSLLANKLRLRSGGLGLLPDETLMCADEVGKHQSQQLLTKGSSDCESNQGPEEAKMNMELMMIGSTANGAILNDRKGQSHHILAHQNESAVRTRDSQLKIPPLMEHTSSSDNDIAFVPLTTERESTINGTSRLSERNGYCQQVVSDPGGVCRVDIDNVDCEQHDGHSAQEEDEEVAKVLSKLTGKSLKAVFNSQKPGTSKMPHPSLINYIENIGETVIIPSKQHVLQYFAGAQSFRLNKVGSDLQITDSTGHPLFDVWLELDCCRCTWVIEAYGKVVMVMHEKPNRSLAQACCWCCVRGRGENAVTRRRPPIMISDWNGDLFGYLVPGDPFLLQNPDRQTVARLLPHCGPPFINAASVAGDAGQFLPANRSSSSCCELSAKQTAECAECFCAECHTIGREEGSGNGVLGTATTIPLAVDTSMMSATADGGPVPSAPPPIGTSSAPNCWHFANGADSAGPGLSWLCVSANPTSQKEAGVGQVNGNGLSEGVFGTASGRHIARLDGFDTILYNKDVTFQMKLLCLAAIVRLSAPWTMPKRGEAGLGGAWSTASSILNCLAYCLI